MWIFRRKLSVASDRPTWICATSSAAHEDVVECRLLALFTSEHSHYMINSDANVIKFENNFNIWTTTWGLHSAVMRWDEDEYCMSLWITPAIHHLYLAGCVFLSSTSYTRIHKNPLSSSELSFSFCLSRKFIARVCLSLDVEELG